MRKSERKALQLLRVKHAGHLQDLVIACTHLLSKELATLNKRMDEIMATLKDVQAESQALQQAVTTLIAQDDANTDALRALQATVAAGGSVSGDDLQSLIDSSTSTRAQIAADLTRNAPQVASVAPPAPAPTDGSSSTDAPASGSDTSGAPGSGQ